MFVFHHVMKICNLSKTQSSLCNNQSYNRAGIFGRKKIVNYSYCTGLFSNMLTLTEE